MALKVVLVTLLAGIPAFLLAPAAPFGPMLWPAPVPLTPPPTPNHVNLLKLLGAVEAASLGLGVAFIIFAWPVLRSAAAADTGRAIAMYLSTAWLLVNWWVHDALHMVTGMNPGGLLWIEYGFHVTLIIAGAALAYSFATIGGDRRVRRA